MMQAAHDVLELEELTLEEMEEQHAAELPGRDLMIAVTVLGIPIVGVHGVQLSLNVS